MVADGSEAKTDGNIIMHYDKHRQQYRQLSTALVPEEEFTSFCWTGKPNYMYLFHRAISVIKMI